MKDLASGPGAAAGQVAGGQARVRPHRRVPRRLGTYAVVVAEQRDGKVTALLTGLAVLDRSSRDRTAAGVADMVLCAGTR